MDVDSIPVGVDFVEHIEAAIEDCDVFLALIGDDWLTVTDHKGRRRIDAPEDYVRLEIEVALRTRVPVIPVLVEGAAMPRSDELPTSIRQLARISAFPLQESHWRRDLDRLVDAIRTTAIRSNRVRRSSGAAHSSVDREATATRPPVGELELPSRVTERWLRERVPTMSRNELSALADALRRRRWTEGELVDYVYCYAPTDVRPTRQYGAPAPNYTPPKRITAAWLRENAARLSEAEAAALARTLVQRGWSEGEIEDCLYRHRSG